MKSHCIRLEPNEDLKVALLKWAHENSIKAAAIVTCVGSLKSLNIRLANTELRQPKSVMNKAEKFEIVSLTGTFSKHGGHFHICVADSNGACFGGHLLESNLIFTTAEVAIIEFNELEFDRQIDPKTGYKELVISETGKI